MKPKSVLIADDDRSLRQALVIRCRELGLEARVSPDGMHAFNTICRQPPDLLILDVNMPAATGLHLCDELARDRRLAPIPVIILTGKSDEATVQHCERLGAHYVWKGLDTWDQLKPVICKLLELPLATGENNESPPAEAATTAPGQPVAEPSAPTVLVIDDDPDVSKAIKIRLQAHGVEVLRAFSGMQGYWMALKEKPNAIITDYAMPEGSGDYVLGRLRDHAVTRGIPVIVLTGRTVAGREDFALKRQMFSLGAKAFLTKPLDFDALINELKVHINFPKKPAQAASPYA